MFLRRGTHDSVKKQNENFKVQGSSHSDSDSSVQNTNFSSLVNKKERKLHYLLFRGEGRRSYLIKGAVKSENKSTGFQGGGCCGFRSSANYYKRLT